MKRRIHGWTRVLSVLGVLGCGDGDKPVLEQPAPPTLPNEPSGRPSLNHAPEIIAVNAPSSVVAGESVTLAVEARDADRDELAVQWELLEGELEGAPGAGLNVEVQQNAGRFSAAVEIGEPVSSIVVRVGVRDPHGASAISDPVAITLEDALVATVTRTDGTIATIVPWGAISSDQTLLRNEEVTVEVSVSDYSYAVEDLVGTGWAAWNGSEGCIHVKAPPSPLGNANLTVMTADGEWTVHFSVVNQPPEIDGVAVPEPLEVGDAVGLEVLAHDPDGDALYYSIEQLAASDSSNGITSEEVTTNPVFALPTQVAGTFDARIAVVDSYGSRASLTTSYTVSSAWRQLYPPPDTTYVLRDMASDDSGLYLALFDLTDYAEQTGVAKIERIARDDGLVSSVGSFESVAGPSFPASDPSVLAIGTALYSHAGADGWVPLAMSPPCDAEPGLASGTELYAVTLCQGEIVVQTQGTAGWGELLRYAAGATEPRLANVAASGENLLIQYYGLDSGTRVDTFVHCCPAQGCATWLTLEGWDPLRIALAPEGVAYLLGNDPASDATRVTRLWQFDEAQMHFIRDGLDVDTGIIAADASLYVAYEGISDQCGPFDCTVVERFNGAAFTELGAVASVSPDVPLLLLGGGTLYVSGRGSSARSVFAIDVEVSP